MKTLALLPTRRAAAATLITLAAGLVATPSSQASESSAGVKVIQGISAPVQAWSRAVEAGDGDAIARMNPESTTVYPPDAMIARGTKNIAAGYLGMFAKFNTKVQIKDAYYVQQGKLVASWGLYTLTLVPKEGGQPIVVNGRFSDLAVPVGNGWQYIVDHASLPSKP
jgi:ketosteroid isomerase-like protein